MISSTNIIWAPYVCHRKESTCVFAGFARGTMGTSFTRLNGVPIPVKGCDVLIQGQQWASPVLKVLPFHHASSGFRARLFSTMFPFVPGRFFTWSSTIPACFFLYLTSFFLILYSRQ
jgi:hypothetical protein